MGTFWSTAHKMEILMKVLVVFGLLALTSSSAARIGKKVMVMSAEIEEPTAAPDKSALTSKLKDLRLALNLRLPNTSPRPGKLPTLAEPDLGAELSETLRYIDEVETEHMKFLDTLDEAGLVSNVRSKSEHGVADLTNQTLTSAHVAASEFLLKNQRERNRKTHSQAHRGMVEAAKLSHDYMRSSGMDAADRVQSARHESISSRLKSNADVRDQILDMRGKRYETKKRQRTRLRNALQAAKADLRASSIKANDAVEEAEREEHVRRRLEKINQAMKARKIYADILIKGTKPAGDTEEEEEF